MNDFMLQGLFMSMKHVPCLRTCSIRVDVTIYRRTSQVTYQPKSVGKMADFESLILNSSHMFI